MLVVHPQASHNVTLVGKIDDTVTTDLVTASESMPPPSNSSIVPTESSLAIAAKPPPQYDDMYPHQLIWMLTMMLQKQ